MSPSPVTPRRLIATATAALALLAGGCSTSNSAATSTSTSTSAGTTVPGGGTSTQASGPDSSVTAAPTSTTTTVAPTTTTTIPIVVTGGIVKVANASGIDGAAGKLTEELHALGFDTREATNAAGPDTDLPSSKIYVRPGAEAVAQSVSMLMGGVDMSPMPTPAWIKGANEALADATVLVMLGHDLAGTDLAKMRP